MKVPLVEPRKDWNMARILLAEFEAGVDSVDKGMDIVLETYVKWAKLEKYIKAGINYDKTIQ